MGKSLDIVYLGLHRQGLQLINFGRSSSYSCPRLVSSTQWTRNTCLILATGPRGGWGSSPAQGPAHAPSSNLVAGRAAPERPRRPRDERMQLKPLREATPRGSHTTEAGQWPAPRRARSRGRQALGDTPPGECRRPDGHDAFDWGMDEERKVMSTAS